MNLRWICFAAERIQRLMTIVVGGRMGSGFEEAVHYFIVVMDVFFECFDVYCRLKSLRAASATLSTEQQKRKERIVGVEMPRPRTRRQMDDVEMGLV